MSPIIVKSHHPKAIGVDFENLEKITDHPAEKNIGQMDEEGDRVDEFESRLVGQKQSHRSQDGGDYKFDDLRQKRISHISTS